MKELLTILQNELIRVQSPVAALWNNGANDNDINKVQQELGFNPHKDAIELFKWKNGIQFIEDLPLGSCWLFPLAIPITLEDGVEAYKYFTVHDKYYREKLFPVFESGGGIMHLIDCDERSTHYGMILKHDIGELEVGREVLATVYDSLSACLTTIIQCYRENVYSFSDDGSSMLLVNDDNRERAIAREINPDADYWKE